MKKLMLLGGLRYLLPVIREAKKLGCYVITVDNVKDNIAHKYSDEYHNVSIIDKDAILTLAKKLKIDGIMSFAVDPGVITAGYVAEEMGLPKPAPYKSVEILQNKDLFRKFLQDNHFNCPQSGGFNLLEEAKKGIETFHYPLIVKPTDSAGSKGVMRIDSKEELDFAFEYAKKNSFSGKIIIEEFIEKKGETTGSDSFVKDGQLDYFVVDDQIFDKKAVNPYTPVAHKWPSSMPSHKQKELKDELQRLMTLLEVKSSIFNIEARIGLDDKVYIMEVSPRGGGNRLAEVLELATGTKLIENSVKASLGLPLDHFKEPRINAIWHSEVLFSNKEGIFDCVEMSDIAKKYVADLSIYAQKGDAVQVCTGANQTIGTIVFKFANEEEYKQLYSTVKEGIYVRVIE